LLEYEKIAFRHGAGNRRLLRVHFIETAIPDVLILEPRVFGDERGFFFESYNQRVWQEITGLRTTFVQDTIPGLRGTYCVAFITR
jgi:hypothetical protein